MRLGVRRTRVVGGGGEEKGKVGEGGGHIT